MFNDWLTVYRVATRSPHITDSDVIDLFVLSADERY